MLDPKHDASWTETHRQSFSICYNYPVYFTRDLFDPANPCLQGALSALEPDKRHRFALFVDDGVTLAAPNLLPRIARHVAARHHHDVALRGDQRLGLSRPAAGAREARRHGGSREGRADPRRGFLPLARARGRRARALRAERARYAGAALRQAAPVSYTHLTLPTN